VLSYVSAYQSCTALLELGHLSGLEMYGTAPKPKHGLVSRLGATPIAYRTEDLVTRTLALTRGAGVDAVFDSMGSADLKQSVRALRKAGSVVAYGFYEAANRGSNILRDVVSQYLRLALWSLPPQRKHVAFYDVRPTQKKHPNCPDGAWTAAAIPKTAGRHRPLTSYPRLWRRKGKTGDAAPVSHTFVRSKWLWRVIGIRLLAGVWLWR